MGCGCPYWLVTLASRVDESGQPLIVYIMDCNGHPGTTESLQGAGMPVD